MLIPHLRTEDLESPLADKHTMRKFLLREFERLNALVTNVEGTRDVSVSAPDGVTIRVQPLEGEIRAISFHHTGHLDRALHTYILSSSGEVRLYLPSTSALESCRYYHLVLRAQ